jgi:hypothetical protein
MARIDILAGLSENLPRKAAAQFLGVCTSILRNRDRDGKLRPKRHPMNRSGCTAATSWRPSSAP